MTTTFFGGKIITPETILSDGTVIVSSDGRIEFIGRDEDAPILEGSRVDLQDRYLAPGFIDNHIHGGYGLSFGEEDEGGENLDHFSKQVSSTGVTGFVIGLEAGTHESLKARLSEYTQVLKRGTSGAEALGFFLETPYMSPNRRGCLPPDYLWPPKVADMKEYHAAAEGCICLITIAPELPEAFEVARFCRSQGVVVSLGHTACDYDTAKRALETDHTNIDHIYNGFVPMHHREPGAIGAALESENVTCEIITDLVHVHPAAVRVVLRCFGIDQTIIVSDCMEALGLPDGLYKFAREDVTVKNGRAYLPDGTIASSTSPMNRNVRNMIYEVGVSLQDAVQMATINPAKRIGVDDRIGVIAVGNDANLIVIDDDINVYQTMVKGEVVYQNGEQ